ncbi:MAG TPA: DUF2914 domain-containing protein [Xanthomonadales bacterium]|nr:DUF2914 domain-containing protein [Xanthomonadales bacterium]
MAATTEFGRMQTGKLSRVIKFVIKCAIVIAATQLSGACTTIKQYLPFLETPAAPSQSAVMAMAAMNDLTEIDAYIKLDNELLTTQIGSVLEAQVSMSPLFSVSRLKVRSAQQVIAVDVALRVLNGQNEPLDAVAEGDVILSFSGSQLIWLPHFNRLAVESTEFTFDGDAYDQATPELEERLLDRFNREIADAVIVLGKNAIFLTPLPLGTIEVGAALADFARVSASGSHELGGVFTVAGSAIMIERSVTSIALDLEFIPNISACPADLVVSRSAFANEVRDREPFSVTRFLGEGGVESHFFTEISGATRSTAVIHYWFADGVPVWLEELPVEPSHRWRTWSSNLIEPRLARHWEVIVVEKETGCILHSQAIRVEPPADPEQTEDPPPVTWEQFHAAFEDRVADFSILGQKPEIALIEVRRPFLVEALHTSLKDIRIVVNFDADHLPPRTIKGTLQPFSAEEIVCEVRDCSTQRSCSSGFTQCVRERDTRDCTRCLFRNPLNNRCVSEGTDPICEAARTAQNEKFDEERAACLEQEALELEDCERLAAQELASCELEANSEQTACQAVKTAVAKNSGLPAFAEIELKLQTGGRLSAAFSNFSIEGDLEGLRLNLGLSGTLRLDGSIRFAPKQAVGPLAACMNAWQKSFRGRVVLPYQPSSMIAPIQTSPADLTTQWSGYILSASINPAPLEAMFVDNPGLLAGCHIGLTVDTVARAISGAGSDYLSGRYLLEIQPSASRIRLSDATVASGDEVYRAPPLLGDTHLKYEIGD